MGLTKQRWEEELERQYSTPEGGRNVCDRCVTDSLLKRALHIESDEGRCCSYCGAGGAADISVLLNEVGDAIMADYADPVEELSYISREGGYQGEVYVGSDILAELDLWTTCDGLYADVEEAFCDSYWCKRHYFSLDQYDVLRFGWEGFAKAVKHQTRYLLFDDSTDDLDASDPVPPSRVLTTIGQLFRDVDLFTDLPKGTKLVRVRVVDEDENPSTFEDLGPPPEQLAAQNRMSPAGIPMFYASFDELTSVLETYDPDLSEGQYRRKKLVLATFESVRDLRMLDHRRVPDLPSPFDAGRTLQRKKIRFLRDFVEDFSKPIKRDGRENFDYVPTQIVTEYVRHLLVDNDDCRIDGVLYPSAANPGQTAVVVFAGPELCGPRQHVPYATAPLLHLVRHHNAVPEEFISSV